MPETCKRNSESLSPATFGCFGNWSSRLTHGIQAPPDGSPWRTVPAGSGSPHTGQARVVMRRPPVLLVGRARGGLVSSTLYIGRARRTGSIAEIGRASGRGRGEDGVGGGAR